MTSPSTSQPRTVEGVVDLDLPGHTISRHVYGHFAEHLGRCIYGGFYVGEDSPIPNEGGIRLDVVEALRALDIPNLRWPGGCFADDYHWKDGIGPREQRPTMVNSHWGDVVEDNSFGTHEFMALCELLGTEPYISANVGSGTVAEASDWVQYLTRADASPMAALRRANGREEPWKVRFWGLGNEPWGCGGRMSAEAYGELARTFGTYSRDMGDNTLYRIAAGAANADYRWTEVLMKALGRGLGGAEDPGFGNHAYQAISFHCYTVAGSWEHKGSATEFDLDEYYSTVLQAQRIEEVLAGHARVMDVYDPQRQVGLVLDEWGTWFDVEPGTNPGFLFQQNALRDALVASVHFDAFHRHADRLVMANIAQTVNVLQAMILTDEDSGALVLTPSYHVFEMNKGHHDAAHLPVHLRGEVPTRTVPDVRGLGGHGPSGHGIYERGPADLTTVSLSASAKDGRALFSLTNLDAEQAVTVRLTVRGTAAGAPTARLLTAGAVQAHNTPAQLEAVAPRDHTSSVRLEGAPGAQTLVVELPAHSFATVELPTA
ncbi:alpha-N-arabinofuranosidase [Quadrisphaera setariae]|uniref:non-reducing end alpha-L-arabinofuranosidase n=1 Tax=Quadrisphaera setariae TaxID=2593304 RepID=A0A5C8ZH88_9ACTN|nr:alpha-L-arabinofuranosidase C-terminal domain-containing protein [Quadrisphaera setariae]TXR56509.1 alpha-N-arabinofuranosidase [Quadrisphaera setariae]